jgi:hypothetical protein
VEHNIQVHKNLNTNSDTSMKNITADNDNVTPQVKLETQMKVL